MSDFELIDGKKAPRDPRLTKEIFKHYTSALEVSQGSFPRHHLIDNLIFRGSVHQIYGTWKSGKSLIVMDAMAHASLGLQWADRRTEQCLVVWLAGESIDDVRARLRAWQIRHQAVPEAMPFFLRKRPVYLTDLELAEYFAAEVAALRQTQPELPVVLVIDTLNRNFGPGADENSAEGMGKFVQNLLDKVAKPNQATVIIVHHSGHGATDRGRGSSVLPAAVDATIKVSKSTDTGTARIALAGQEMRNSEAGNGVAFLVEVQELPWSDNFGRQDKAPVLRFDGPVRPLLVLGTVVGDDLSRDRAGQAMKIAEALAKHQAEGLAARGEYPQIIDVPLTTLRDAMRVQWTRVEGKKAAGFRSTWRNVTASLGAKGFPGGMLKIPNPLLAVDDSAEDEE